MIAGPSGSALDPLDSVLEDSCQARLLRPNIQPVVQSEMKEALSRVPQRLRPRYEGLGVRTY